MPSPSVDEVLKQFVDFYYGKTRPALIDAESQITAALTMPLVQLRDGFDDLVLAILNEDLRQQKIGEAIGHLRIAGVEAWEECADIRIEELEKILDKTTKKRRRLITSHKLMEHLQKNMDSALKMVKEGRVLKPAHFDDAVSCFTKAFEITDETIDKYYARTLPGSHESETRTIIVITLVVGLITAVFGFVLGKVF